METMTVEMELTSRQNTANQKGEHASVTCSLATTEIAFQEFTSAVNFEVQSKVRGVNNFFKHSDGDNDCLDNSDEDNRHQCSKFLAKFFHHEIFNIKISS